jgi:bacterioferritin-associated ferredoxin
LASGNGTAPPTINGTRAERRRVQNNTPMPGAVGAAEQTLAQVIGETVALHLAQMLGQLLPQMPWREDCYFCIVSARQMVRAYQVAVTTAEQAAEPVPDPPAAPQVARAVTHVPITQLVQTPAGPVPGTCAVPACWDHVQVQADGPKPTGLFAPDGRPIVRSGG